MDDAPVQQTLADTVAATLAEIGDRDGPSVAPQLAVSNIRASTRFILDAIGPRAARTALRTTAESLEEEIRSRNHGSGLIQ